MELRRGNAPRMKITVRHAILAATLYAALSAPLYAQAVPEAVDPPESIEDVEGADAPDLMSEATFESEQAEDRGFELPGDLSTTLEFEGSAFFSPALYPGQEELYGSIALQPEYVLDWDDGDQLLEIILFGRLDSHDKRRTHADIREFSWIFAGSFWELRAGVRKVYWGATESRQLVDIINQVDAVEDLRGQERLGQPMVNPALISDFGTLEIYVLPWFRERAFPGPKGRLRPPLRVSTDRAEYESADRERHVDGAARYSHTLGPLDFGVSYFQGTAREPVLIQGVDTFSSEPILIPRYELIRRGGFDAQLILGGWALKAEAVYEEKERAPSENFYSAVAGFEYTFVGIFESFYDLGVIAEYLYDERLEAAPHPFDDDIFAGLRLVFNDEAGSEILAGAIVDRHRGTALYQVEGSRRFGDNWKLAIEMQLVEDAPPEDANIFALRNDDLVRLTLSYFL